MERKDNQRVAYGEMLVELGKEDPRVVVLEADLSKSTMGHMFEVAYPERFYEMGIAEANMASVAAGLALTGKIPFMSTFAAFATGRCYDQIRTSICIPALNVKICGSSAGMSDYGDGSTHQSIDDIALMTALPGMQVFVPADGAQLRQIMRYMHETPGPMYLRANRNDLPVVTEGTAFQPGKAQVLREGTDTVVFACGVMVSCALEAAERLQKEGVSVRVVNVASIKPLDEAQIRSLAKGMRGIVTAEEHSVLTGLGAAITRALAKEPGVPVEMVGVNDRFGTSAENYQILLDTYGLTADAVAATVKKALG